MYGNFPSAKCSRDIFYNSLFSIRNLPYKLEAPEEERWANSESEGHQRRNNFGSKKSELLVS